MPKSCFATSESSHNNSSAEGQFAFLFLIDLAGGKWHNELVEF